MKKPYTICHMMTSVDGRIDCNMTATLPGNPEYYETLDALNAPTRVSGRVTAELEMAEPGEFQAKRHEPYGKEGYSKKKDADGYEVIVDTHGKLIWKTDESDGRPLLILTSEDVEKEYLDDLDAKNISWIAAGKGHADLQRAAEILADAFSVERMAVVGGGHINAGFLQAGLLDEISILMGPGIDGRKGMTSVFDGLPEKPVTLLKLESVQSYPDGAVWLRWKTDPKADEK